MQQLKATACRLFLITLLIAVFAQAHDAQKEEQGQLPRIVAMGDLHGDLANTLAIMKHTGLVDDQGHWAGGNTIFVQTVSIFIPHPNG